MNKHVAIYTRVSSAQQDTASQLPDLERWAANQGEPIQRYSDTFTGRTMDRPGWGKLQADIDAGKVQAVVVWRLDRLGRTAAGLTALFADLQRRRVNLVSIKDGLDLSTPAGRLMAHVLASVAQFETEIRMERTLAGQSVARGKGKRWGGSKPGRRLVVSDEQLTTLRRLHAEGATVAGIARAVGLSRPTVYHYLKPTA